MDTQVMLNYASLIAYQNAEPWIDLLTKLKSSTTYSRSWSGTRIAALRDGGVLLWDKGTIRKLQDISNTPQDVADLAVIRSGLNGIDLVGFAVTPDNTAAIVAYHWNQPVVQVVSIATGEVYTLAGKPTASGTADGGERSSHV